MSASQLSLYGLQAGDVTTVSDHLPHVADFRRKVPVDVAHDGGGAGRIVTLQAGSPERGRARLVLDLERAARVQLAVYDVRGAHVVTLRDETAGDLSPGRHILVWDGRGARGRRAPSGTYVVRLAARGEGFALATSTKVLLLH
jgi:flagellar hook assembly protein FlgD